MTQQRPKKRGDGGDGPKRKDAHFLLRAPNGSTRIRLWFPPEEVSAIEDASAATPVIEWLHGAIRREVRRAVAEPRRQRAAMPPPE